MSTTWRAVGVSVAGSSHVAAMTRCQDYCSRASVTLRSGEEVLMLALADGAGSAPASAHGANVAVTAVLAQVAAVLALENTVHAESLRVAVGEARDTVLQIAEDYGHDPRDYASTLLVLVLFAERALAAQIGDGAIVVDNGSLYPLTWPQQGEYANLTHFLTDGDALDHLEIAEAEGVVRAALFSDGLQSVALHYESRSAFEPFFNPFFEYLERSEESGDAFASSLSAYLESPGMCARTDDDKSLMLAVRA